MKPVEIDDYDLTYSLLREAFLILLPVGGSYPIFSNN